MHGETFASPVNHDHAGEERGHPVEQRLHTANRVLAVAVKLPAHLCGVRGRNMWVGSRAYWESPSCW